MSADEPIARVRLDHPDDELLDEFKGRLLLQFNSHQDLRAKSRVVSKSDGKSQTLGGAEAFLMVFGGSAALEATRLVIAEFRARGIECRLESLPDRNAQSVQGQPTGTSKAKDR